MFTYTEGDLIVVVPVSSLGGTPQLWSSLGYTISLSTSLVPDSNLNSVGVVSSFILKHLGGVRPTIGANSTINSVIKRGAKVDMEYVGSRIQGSKSNYFFEATVSEIQAWSIDASKNYQYDSTASDLKVQLTGYSVF